MNKILCLACILLTVFTAAFAQLPTGPKALIVNAHPDDETGVAAIVYKITHEMNGQVDQCVITNGEGGYKYSTLGNVYYGLELTDPVIGRQNLPRIRKQELMNGDKILGINNIFFLDQKDAHYGLNEHEPLDTTWNVNWVMERLHDIMMRTKYDYVFCMVPDPTTHAHHKAATILALRVINALPAAQKPIVLGFSGSSKKDVVKYKFNQYADYKETKMLFDTAIFKFDLTTPFGYKNVLNYTVVVNWEIAEHKSQGTMQMFSGRFEYEDLFYFALNGIENLHRCDALFEKLKITPYKKLTY